MKITATQYINEALKYERLTESPPNSNNIIFNTHFYGREVRDGDTSPNSFYPWCVTFPWDLFRMLNASELFLGGKKSASSGYILQEAAKLARLISKPEELRKGDIAVLDFPGTAYKTDHTVIVISNTPATKTFHTVEGNTSVSGSQSNGGQVLQKDRPYSVFVGAFRPDYLPEPAATVPISENILRVGSKGKDVTFLQNRLRTFGYNIAIDGDFGPKTEAAVKKFQREHGLVIDGIVGPATWRELHI